MKRLAVDASVAVKWFLPEMKRTFYDSLYLALAESEACPLVTADRRLFNAVKPFGLDLVWIEDIV